MFALTYELGGGVVDAGDLLLASGVASADMLLVGFAPSCLVGPITPCAYDKAAPAHRRFYNLESKLLSIYA